MGKNDGYCNVKHMPCWQSILFYTSKTKGSFHFLLTSSVLLNVCHAEKRFENEPQNKCPIIWRNAFFKRSFISKICGHFQIL